MRRKKNQIAELETLEEDSGLSNLSTTLQIREPVPRRFQDVFRDFSKDKKIILHPEFQRDFVWSTPKQAELIKSVWRGIPLPMFYFSVSNDRTKEVIDGQQRLTTLFGFIEPKTIKDKKVRSKLLKKIKIKGKDNKDINRVQIQNKIMDSNIYCVDIYEDGLNTNDKFEIFRSLNLGATPLKNQEIRNAIYQKEVPHLNRALRKGAKKIERIVGMKNFRMVFEDLVLRFYIINSKGYEEKVSALIKKTDVKTNFNEESVKTIDLKFNKFIKYMHKIFGRKSFQVLAKIKENKNLSDKKWEKFTFSDRINQGLFHLFSYYIPKYHPHHLNKRSPKKNRQEFIKLMRNSKFIQLITGSGTDSTKNIIISRTVFEKLYLIPNYGHWTKIDIRNVSREFKKTILENIPYCYLCYGKLKSAEHLEYFTKIHGEHINSFKDGNNSTSKNILLAHKTCNQEKSGNKLENYRKQKKFIVRRKENKGNIPEYLRCLKNWNSDFPLTDYKKLLKIAKMDTKL